ncbi:MAG: hypothetical protein OQL06_15865 [Gammaproteobacteria bacterium]|nr:hypothetical protein [Gammaproteobacteria bacterium]
MVGETDNKDKDESRKIAIALIALVLVLGVAILLMLPMLSEIVTVHLSPGLGLKDSAVISFFVTVVIMIVFAITSGDGLLGEIQFILGGFFLFFVIIWLLVAWIF